MSQATALLADAETSIKAGDWDAAIEQLESLKQDQPSEPEVYQKLAYALAVRGKFQSVISTNLELIRVLVEAEQLEPADEVVGRVLGLRPESGEARERRIEIENKRGNTTRAVALSRELARLCIDQGDGERSIRLLQDAQKHEPGNLDIALELAEMFVSHGHIQDGANQYRKVANAFQEAGNIAKAAEAYRRMKVVQSDDPEVLLTLGRLYTELGKLDEAEQEFRSVLRHDLEHQQALLQLGLVCQLKGRFRSGILAFNKVLQNNPDLVEAKRKLGELHHSQGMMPESVDFFLKAAQGYLEAEERDDAIECFQIVLSVDENNATAQQGLTNLGAPVQPKAFEPPQPPTPPEEPAPEPVVESSVSTPEPVSGSSVAMERTERLAPTDFSSPGASSDPEPPKPEPASPKKPSGSGAVGRKTGLTGGGFSGGMRKGLVAPGGGDKPMLGGDKPMLGRPRSGIREGLGKKVLGGGPMMMGGGGDKPVLGSPSGPGRRAGFGRTEPAASTPEPVAHNAPAEDPLEDFSADMALEDVFSEPTSPPSASNEGSEDFAFPDFGNDSDDSGSAASLDFDGLGSDLFDDSSPAPTAQSSGAVLGAFSFDAEEDESAPDEGDLRPTYAGEKPVFDEDMGDDLFDFGADPDAPSAAPATPTLGMGGKLFDEDDALGDDLFSEDKPTASLFDDESVAGGADLFDNLDVLPASDGVSENGAAGDAGLFDGEGDPFGNLFDPVESSVEASAETIGGSRPSLSLSLDSEPVADEDLSGSDFGQLFDEPASAENRGETAGADLFSSLDLPDPVEEETVAGSGLFSGDSDSSDLFQDDLFSAGDEPSSGGEIEAGATLFDSGPAPQEESNFFSEPAEEMGAEFGSDSDGGLFDGASGDADLFNTPEASSLFEDEPQASELEASQAGGLFDEEPSGGDLFSSFDGPPEPVQEESSGASLFSEPEGDLFDSGSDGLFDDLPMPESESESLSAAGGLFDEPTGGGLFDEGDTSLDFAGGSDFSPVPETNVEPTAFDNDDLFSSGFEEGPPLDLDLPMPGDEPVTAAAHEQDGGGLFGDDAVGDLFSAEHEDFAEAPLDFTIPEPTDAPAAAEVAEESPLDFDIPAPGDESVSFASGEEQPSDDLFATTEPEFASSDTGLFEEDAPLDFEIPDLPTPGAEAEPVALATEPEPEVSKESFSFETPEPEQQDAPLDFDIPMAVEESLDFDIPAMTSGEPEVEESPVFAQAADEDVFAPREEDDLFSSTEFFPVSEASESTPEPSIEDEPDEVSSMLEMTLPSVEIAPEELAPLSLDVDFAVPQDSTVAVEASVEGFGESEALALDLDLPTASPVSALSEAEQLEIAQTNQADALEASVADADVASKIAAFRKTLEENPENLVLRVRLADIHLRYGLLEDAVVQYRQVLRRNPDSIPLLHRVIQAEFWNENYVEAGDSLLALAQLHLKRDEHHDALDALQSVLSLDPLHFEARQALVSVFTSLEESKLAAHHLRQLAETALTKGEIPGAILAFQQLLEISEDPTFEERLAQIYETQGDVEKALSSFQSLLGRYRAEERWEEAARVTERIVELDPSLLDEREGLIALYQRLGLNAQVVEQQYQLARLYQAGGETARAVGLFEDVIKVQLENFDARRHLVDAYLTLGRVSSALEQAESLTEHYLDTKDHATAIALYSNLVEADPENVELQERLVKFYGLAGDPENARTRWIAISHQHEKAGRYEKAAEAIQKALELDENQLELLQRLAVIYAEKIGDHQAALTCLRKLFGLAPEKTEAVKMYIDLLLRAEQVSEAGQVLQKLEQAGGESVEIKANVIASLRASVEGNPSDLKARFNYGELCYHLGDLDHAIEQFQQTRRHPDYELMSYNMLGLCFASKRGYMMLDLAINQFKKGLDTKGRPEQDYLETRYNLAMVLYQNNRAAEALAELKECYNVDIAYRDVRNWIQKIESEQASAGA